VPRIEWPEGVVSRIPAWVYSDEDLYRRELERIFYGPHWSYVGLEAELPGPGAFKTTMIGERSVIVTRDEAGEVHVVENRCAHRGVRFCQERSGTVERLSCPYHKWSYGLDGALLGLPFRKGFKGQGGMPEDFELSANGLTRLKVARHNGLIMASFDHAAPPLADYLGPEVLHYVSRVFDGRPLKLLGYSRQRIPGNWKLMQENIKDPYHPGLLHAWFVTFGLWRADQQSQMVMDAQGRHACMISRRNAGGAGEATQGVDSFKAEMALNDPRLLDVVPEAFWNGPSVVMTTVFPSLIIQQQVNSLSTRQIIPRGPGIFDFVWTHFGFEDDDEAMTNRRLLQANLFGPAGFVSADDGEVIEGAQQGLSQSPDSLVLAELDGRGVAPTPHMVTETLIRGMYGYWRSVMEV
jgi:salicylate 5-hydroxylase large subunit